MRPSKNPTLKDLRERTTQMLQRIDDTPIAQIDAIYYQHYFEELRLLAEEWQARTVPPPPIKPTKGGGPPATTRGWAYSPRKPSPRSCVPFRTSP